MTTYEFKVLGPIPQDWKLENAGEVKVKTQKERLEELLAEMFKTAEIEDAVEIHNYSDGPTEVQIKFRCSELGFLFDEKGKLLDLI